MKRTSLARVAIITTLLISSPLYAQEAMVEAPAPQGDIISGGVGEREMEKFVAVEKDYSVKLIFSQPDGEYLANVSVTIRDHKKKVVMEASSQGPIVLIKLKPGTYTLVSKAGGDTQTQHIVVRSSKLSTYYIHLHSA